MSLRKKFNEEHSEVDTGPLNDILFILMFFFLIISTLANPNVIKLTNPKSKSDTKAKQSIVVSIRKDGRTYIGQQQVIFDSLSSELMDSLMTKHHDQMMMKMESMMKEDKMMQESGAKCL